MHGFSLSIGDDCSSHFGLRARVLYAPEGFRSESNGNYLKAYRTQKELDDAIGSMENFAPDFVRGQS